MRRAALALVALLVTAACAHPTTRRDLYARSAVDSRVREFKLGEGLQEAHCSVSHAELTECSCVTAEGNPCRFSCRSDECVWEGR